MWGMKQIAALFKKPPPHAPNPPTNEAEAVVEPKFQPLGLNDFLDLNLPRREMLLAPILPERSLSMVFAPRGLGKSWFALSSGIAIATGASFLRWQAPRPRRVLLVDGEMPLADLQKRLAALSVGRGLGVANDHFRILAADATEKGIDISCVEGQLALEPHLKDVDLVIFDNLSTLMGSGSESAGESWLPLQNWLLRLRRKGIAVLLVHHAGVNGKQRGTSRREDALDTVIALRHPVSARNTYLIHNLCHPWSLPMFRRALTSTADNVLPMRSGTIMSASGMVGQS
jgi:AAA domain